MTLMQLQYFEVLARVLHYTRAAEELHIAQPSLSYSIRELEKELGVKLFRKEKRRTVLTEYGERFLPYVQESLRLKDMGVAVLKQMRGLCPMTVRLGYFHSLSASLIPSIVNDVYKEPENKPIRFQFSEGTSLDILAMLRKGQLDLALCTPPRDWSDSVTILRQPLYLTVSSGHPLAGRSSVAFDDYAKEPLVMLGQECSLRRQLDSFFREHSAIPNIAFEVSGGDDALQYVRLNFGVSILPWIPAMANGEVRSIPIIEQERELVRSICLIWDHSRSLSPSARTVRNLIVRNYASAAMG